jgi:hypothetical protein
MNSNPNPDEMTPDGPVPNIDEVPLREPDQFEDVPLPRKVTRETEAGSEKEDLNHGGRGH